MTHDEHVTALEKERDFWNEQHSDMCLRYHAKVAKMEQERDSLLAANVRLVKSYDAIAGTPCEQIRHAQEVEQLQQQLAAMTQERDGLMRRIEEEEPIFHDMLNQLAASQERMKELEDWHLEAYADIKRNDELQAQLAEANKDCDDLRAMCERLLAKLSEGKVMVDDIKIMGEL